MDFIHLRVKIKPECEIDKLIKLAVDDLFIEIPKNILLFKK